MAPPPNHLAHLTPAPTPSEWTPVRMRTAVGRGVDVIAPVWVNGVPEGSEAARDDAVLRGGEGGGGGGGGGGWGGGGGESVPPGCTANTQYWQLQQAAQAVSPQTDSMAAPPYHDDAPTGLPPPQYNAPHVHGEIPASAYTYGAPPAYLPVDLAQNGVVQAGEPQSYVGGDAYAEAGILSLSLPLSLSLSLSLSRARARSLSVQANPTVYIKTYTYTHVDLNIIRKTYTYTYMVLIGIENVHIHTHGPEYYA